MNAYMIALDKDILANQVKARASRIKAMFCHKVGRDHDCAIHKEAARFCFEQAKKLRLQRQRVLAARDRICRAA